MIDFHCHILPNIDDGSKNVSESLRMIEMQKSQGITKVVATPHFYANHNSVDFFLESRDRSFESIRSSLPDDSPEILLGAEVKYYEGISRLENLRKLCVGNSKLLLLEMSMSKWKEYTLRELRELSLSGNVIVVLAHIERYLKFQDKGVLEELIDYGTLIQSNAKFFLRMNTRRKALSMLCNKQIHFIGSDCHNLTDRAPDIGSAISYIERKAGSDLLTQMNIFAERFL